AWTRWIDPLRSRTRLRRFGLGGNDHLDRHDGAEEADEHRSVGAPGWSHGAARIVDDVDGGIVACEHGAAGDILARSIIESSEDAKRCLFVGLLEENARGLDIQARELSPLDAPCAFSHPTFEELRLLVVEPNAAPVGSISRRLRDHQARPGVGEIDASAFELPNDRVIVRRRVASPEREFEPATSRRSAVTRAAVATCTRENGYDFRVEVDRRRSAPCARRSADERERDEDGKKRRSEEKHGDDRDLTSRGPLEETSLRRSGRLHGRGPEAGGQARGGGRTPGAGSREPVPRLLRRTEAERKARKQGAPTRRSCGAD